MRVVLADDAVLFREGMARILTEAGFEVAGQAGDAAGLLALVDAHAPAVAVVDIRMPPGHATEGIEAAATIRARAPGVGLLLLSQHVDTAHALRLMTDFAGGVGYLLKDRVADLATFASDVRRVARGEVVIDPELVTRLVARPRRRTPLDTLTDQERRVLGLMAEGHSNGSLSATLHLSPKTVESHVRNIFTKLDLEPDASTHRRVRAVLAYLRA